MRHAGLVRGFQEIKVRSQRPGRPTLERVSAEMQSTPGLRLILEGKLARAQRLLATLETEALARSLGTGRAVTVLALDGRRHRVSP